MKSEVVRAFLDRLRVAVAARRVTLIPRAKNRADMLAHGLRFDDILETLRNLQLSHFSRGPEADDAGFPGEVMVFIAPVDGVDFYIKVRLHREQGADSAVTISFHEEGNYA